MPIAADEDIVRAICTDKWDGTRVARSLFKGRNISVSRLALIALSEHWDMFRKRLERRPERRLELIGEINVGHLQEIGRGYHQPIELTVEPKPEGWNRRTQKFRRELPRGLLIIL
jgi:hypothetical protein